jgi:aminobenzoyl-glutamate transport protein
MDEREVGLKGETRPVGLGTILSLQIGYSIGLFIGLMTLLILWYLIGLPVGSGAGIHL